MLLFANLLQLRERVSLCKAAEKESEETKRDDILQNKEASFILYKNNVSYLCQMVFVGQI